MENLSIDKLYLFIIFVLPGFISTKIWSVIVACESKNIKDYIFECIGYSAINFALLFWLIDLIMKIKNNPILFIFLTILILFVFPIIWPILLNILINSKLLKGIVINPLPTSWDYYFNLRKPCFMIIHLKNGKMIGGYYGPNSYSSSFPNKECLYLERVWKISKGEFEREIESTDGLWINKDYFEYIEFFKDVQD